MDEQRWLKITEAFDTASRLEPSLRPAFLATLTAEESREVQSLLDADAASGEFLEVPSAELSAGQKLDRYVIETLVARGGMGEVYRANRGGAINEPVAIKVMSPVFANRQSIQMFARERQILAQLSHPGIVTLIDSGETAGRPYFVMEWIEGQPLHRWYREVEFPDRLKLFERICGAVHAAHQSLIVHCDLKPSNVMVTSDASVKLLDFGISRLLSSQNDLPMATRTSLRVLTLNYASPEQARDLPAGIPSDIYSLGLILYELAAGRLAQPTEGLPLDQAITTITSQDLKFDAAFPSDLAAIIRKACDKDSDRRYASASELAADVERYRQGYPVLARNPTLGYYARKFVRRHRLTVVTGAVASIALLIALAAFAVQFQQNRQQRILAERRFAVARDMAQLMVFEGPAKLSRLPGTLETRRWMTERATQYLERLASDVQGDASLALVVAKAYRQVAYHQFNFNEAHLNDPAAALLNLERGAKVLESVTTSNAKILEERMLNHLERPYIVLRRRSEARENEDRTQALALALQALNYPGHHDLSAREAYRRASNLDRPQDERLAIWRQLEAYYGANPALSRNLALVHKNVADIYVNRKQFDQAIAHAEAAVGMDQQRLKQDPLNAQIQMDLSFSLGLLGQTYGLAGAPARAVPILRQSVSLRRAIAQNDPTDMRAKERLAWMLGELGRRLLEVRQSSEGIQSIEEAIRLRKLLKANGAGRNSLPDLHAMLAAEAGRQQMKARACSHWAAAQAALPKETSWVVDQVMPIREIQERSKACPKTEE